MHDFLLKNKVPNCLSERGVFDYDTAMLDKQFAEQKLRSAIALIDSLLSGDWPYSDSQAALRQVNRALQEEYNELRALDSFSDQEVVNSHCRQARSLLSDFAGFIGFILRSSNVRNTFEFYHPIKTIGELLLGTNLKLVVGSEWNYTPFVYPIPTETLKEFIFVGLPASEAQNALLVPIAGHELVIWN